MRTTEYFIHTRTRPDRLRITDEWILRAIHIPVSVSRQMDGRLRHWAYIQEEGKYLRVVLLADGETVHNAFFDSGFSAGAR